jgi:hypothetical protein
MPGDPGAAVDLLGEARIPDQPPAVLGAAAVVVGTSSWNVRGAHGRKAAATAGEAKSA